MDMYRTALADSPYQLPTIPREDWIQDAACVGTDPEAFFPEHNTYDRSAAALKVCAGCPVVRDCLAYALAHGEEFGVWGGLSAVQRKRLMKRGCC